MARFESMGPDDQLALLMAAMGQGPGPYPKPEDLIECPDCEGLGTCYRDDGSYGICPGCEGSGRVQKKEEKK